MTAFCLSQTNDGLKRRCPTERNYRVAQPITMIRKDKTDIDNHNLIQEECIL